MGFWSNLALMTTVTVDKTVSHLRTNVAPSVQGATLRMRELVDDQITALTNASIHVPLTILQQNLGDKFKELSKVTFPTEKEARLWVAANPGKTAILVTSGMVFFAPGLVSAPVLGALGFGAEGVAAGSMAAGVQAGLGNVPAGSLFAILQSAGSGGLGYMKVNAVVQGFTGLVWGSTAAESVVKKVSEESEERKKDDSKL